MATTHLVSVEEYLHSTFEPDAEYVEGRIVQRSVPQKPHGKMQTYLIGTLFVRTRRKGHYEVWDAQRIRTKSNPARYRIPDICVTVGEPDEDVFTEAPFLCIEINSPDDVVSELRAKIEEYLEMGVAYVWVVDPILLSGEIYTRDRIERARDGVFRAGDIEVNIREV